MKSINFVIAFTFLFLNIGFTQKNTDIIENKPLKDFTSINSNMAADIYLTQADSFSFQIEGRSKVIKLLEVEVIKGVLTIKLDKDSDIWDNFEKAIIRISAPYFENLHLSGAGKIRSTNRLSGKSLNILSSGANSVFFKDIEYDNLSLELSGVGNIDMSGKVQKATIELSGTGNIDVMDLVVQDANCHISGLGALSCNVENNLDAEVSGMGKIRYKGEPKSLKKSVSGLGKVKSN